MLNPPKDEHGKVIPHDEKELVAPYGLIRLINPNYHVVEDHNVGGMRITTAAYSPTNRDPHYGMSVDLEQLLAEDGLPPSYNVPNGWGAVFFDIEGVRGLGLLVGSDPVLPDNPDKLPTNPYHGQVWGVKDTFRKRLRAMANSWVVRIPNTSL